MEIGYKVAPSLVAYSIVDALAAADQLGFPLLVRAAYSLGGLNSGFADSHEQLVDICTKAFTVSTQLFIDKSLKGWKEVEYEVVRDVFDNCVTVKKKSQFFLWTKNEVEVVVLLLTCYADLGV